VDGCTCGPGVRWCARADALFDVPGLHVLDVARDEDGRLVLTVETEQQIAGCPGCGGSGRARPTRTSGGRRPVFRGLRHRGVAQAGVALP
jgi:predicted deacylase